MWTTFCLIRLDVLGERSQKPPCFLQSNSMHVSCILWSYCISFSDASSLIDLFPIWAMYGSTFPTLPPASRNLLDCLVFTPGSPSPTHYGLASRCTDARI